ncbi:MAG: glycosyltransferase family 2 protein [Planctomycetota bacterium]|nr:glycosyltransferase family 2 protein [Planctomycetota bacterium]
MSGNLNKLTVIVPCKNEEANIGACISSFAEIADEIIVADSGSTDRTLTIVKRIGGCKIIEREYRTSGDFKNWAIPQSKNDWILLVDADERVTPKLAKEITRLLSGDPKNDGYWIYRANHFMGHRIRHGGWNNDCVLRLFRRDLSRYEGPSDHGEVNVSSGKVGTLKNRMTHYSYWSYDDFFRKLDRYTALQAKQWNEAGKRTNFFQMIWRPSWRFFRDYFLQLGFLDGLIGLQLAMIWAFYAFTKQARLWAIQNGLAPNLDPFLVEELQQDQQQKTKIACSKAGYESSGDQPLHEEVQPTVATELPQNRSVA